MISIRLKVGGFLCRSVVRLSSPSWNRPCFFIRPSANRPRHAVLLIQEVSFTLAMLHGRGLPPSVHASAENVCSAFASRKGGNLGPGRHEVVEVDEDVDCDESSESTGVRSTITARLATPTPAAVPWGRAAPAGR